MTLESSGYRDSHAFRAGGLFLLPSLIAGPLAAQAPTTTRVSVSSSGAQGNSISDGPSVSADGRYVAFGSDADNLVSGDTNGWTDVFVHDNQTGFTTRVSISSAGVQGNFNSGGPSISADGRYVAFESWADNLVPGDTNAASDVFVRDRQTNMTERVSVGLGGAQGNGSSAGCFISASGRYVAFGGDATNLVAGDTNADGDVFVRDRQTNMTERVSLSYAGIQGDFASWYPSISADGRFVAFNSRATNLVPGDTNGFFDVFVRDRQSSTTALMSTDSTGALGNNDSGSGWPSISADGHYVAFVSVASNLVAGDTNGFIDVFVHDRLIGATVRVSVDSSGLQGNASSGPSFNAGPPNNFISEDGRYVAFSSWATNLIPGDTNSNADVFVHDSQTGSTERVSVDSSGTQADDYCEIPSISADGRIVAFVGLASNLVSGDTNGCFDVFVRDRGAPAPGTDLCQAGAASVIACPCSNPPANAPRGCDNSAGTGGAQLTSSGSASVSSDTLVFVTNGEKPTATSIVLQGNAEIANGVAFGQGVRCAGGGLKRLYVKTAAGGSINAPAAGDPSVSARSAALGDTIGAGTSRWYAVYYRDPVVLGGCPLTSTYNVTQTQLVAWGA